MISVASVALLFEGLVSNLAGFVVLLVICSEYTMASVWNASASQCAIPTPPCAEEGFQGLVAREGVTSSPHAHLSRMLVENMGREG